nr:uncharacterized protein LOC111425262 [Onthophagus taurus]
MTKRSCPFEDDYIPQTKIYLTTKGYEKSNVKAMENVWNKTRDLLFEGAKREKNKDDKEEEVSYEEQCDYCLKKFDLLNDCRLCHHCYCSSCSLPIYDDEVTEFICLSCA